MARTLRPKKRCPWSEADPLYVAYHDEEWGVPSHDDRHLFEMLILESMQSGLSWLTILRKREGFRRAFANFDAASVARFSEADLNRLLTDPAIVRNRAKIEASVSNARATIKIAARYGSLDEFIWRVIDRKPITNRLRSYRDAPSHTSESEALAREFKAHGFKFVGPTVCYAFMQAVGMVNDHEVSCFRHREIEAARRKAEGLP
jgi:DNA-3-methyladenine glycosylase I